MRKSTLTLSLITLVVTAIVITYSIVNTDEQNRITHQAASGDDPKPMGSPNATATNDQPHNKPPNTPQSANSGPEKLSALLIESYNTEDNLRKFVKYALQHIEKGGAYYASRVLKQCRDVRTESRFGQQVQTEFTGGDSNDELLNRSRAAENLRRQCTDFTDQELSDLEIEAIILRGEERGDPILASLKAFNKIEGIQASDARRKALQELLSIGDALAIQEVGQRIALTRETESSKLGYLFEGQFYPIDSDIDVGLAIYLLPCGAGLACDATEYDIALRCASGAGCFASRFDYVKNMLRDRPEAYEKVLDVYDRMAKSITSAGRGFLQ